MCRLMLLIAFIGIIGACATNAGPPQCKGPAVPINATVLHKDEAR